MRISDWSSDVCSSDLHIAYDHDDDWAQGFYEGMLRFPVEQSFHAGRNAKATLLAGVTSAREVGAGDFIDVALRNAINAGDRQSVVEGKRGSVRVDIGGRRITKKKKVIKPCY